MRTLLTLALLTTSLASAAKWEYASFISYGEGATLHLPTSSISAKNNADLMTKLKCAKPSELNHAVLNCLGMQGWELVTSDKSVLGGYDITTWIFKRPGK